MVEAKFIVGVDRNDEKYVLMYDKDKNLVRINSKPVEYDPKDKFQSLYDYSNANRFEAYRMLAELQDVKEEIGLLSKTKQLRESNAEEIARKRERRRELTEILETPLVLKNHSRCIIVACLHQVDVNQVRKMSV